MNRTGKGVAVSLMFLLSAMFLVLLSLLTPGEASVSTRELRCRLQRDGHIIHAGGYLTTTDGEQVQYTNSVEAMENLWEKGNRFCEADILKTTDGMLVCGHPGENTLVYGSELSPDAAGADFLASLLYGEFHPLSVESLAAFMKTHEELYVLADLKSEHLELCKELAERYPELQERLIMQIYRPEEYEPVRELGFRHIVYSVLSAPEEERSLLRLTRFARSHELLGFLFPNGYFTADWKLALAQKITGTPVILITLNDSWEISYYLDHELAMAVYTDRTDLAG